MRLKNWVEVGFVGWVLFDREDWVLKHFVAILDRLIGQWGIVFPSLDFERVEAPSGYLRMANKTTRTQAETEKNWKKIRKMLNF